MVGMTGFEPARLSTSQMWRDTKLRDIPKFSAHFIILSEHCAQFWRLQTNFTLVGITGVEPAKT